MCAVSGHRCACPPEPRPNIERVQSWDIWTDNCHYIEGCHSIRAGYWCPPPPTHVRPHGRCHTVSWSPSQLISELPSLQEGCTQEISEFPPPLPTHLSPHWHHFSPASPRPLSLSNSELPAHIYPLTLTPPLSLDCASLISPLQISPWPLVSAC